MGSRWGGGRLAGARVLLPLAPVEIIDSGVNSPWYTMTALFFAVLWRPGSWPAILAAALIAFSAASSEILTVIYAPLLLIRLVGLPRLQAHPVTGALAFGLEVRRPSR